MRYDKRIALRHYEQGEYDTATGDYAEPLTIETIDWASVTDASSENVKLIYGKMRKGVKVVRVRGTVSGKDTEVLIDGVKYNIDNVKSFEGKATLFVSEVN